MVTEHATKAQVLLRIFETVCLIRAFDDKIRELISTGQQAFLHYPVRGHEIIAAGVAAALMPTDYMTTTYRGLADEIAKGVPLSGLWAELLGRETGTSQGWGGPMHVTDPEHGLMLTTGIVGGGLPVASGLGLSSQLHGDNRVTICNFGDAATNIGAFHEALNLASLWSLPVVFVCQNNQWGEHTPFHAAQKTETVAERAAAYAMTGRRVDGTDAWAVFEAANDGVRHARSGQGPVLLECVTYRTLGHILSDQNEYMDQEVLGEHVRNDLVERLRVALLADGHADEATLKSCELQSREQVVRAYEVAVSAKPADPQEMYNHICVPVRDVAEPGLDDAAARTITYRAAITEALDLAMTEDHRVIVMGEDVADSAGGGVFKLTEGLSTKHGDSRVRNTPISEEGFVGAAVGAALAGLRPVAEIMLMDFLWVPFDQIANHAAKLRFMSGGRTPVPLTVRITSNGGSPVGAQHAQSLEAALMHTPGLKVVMPSTPYDAKGLLLSCIDDEDPCVFIESTALLATRGPVPAEPYRIPLGAARLRRSGDDVTIVSYGRLVGNCLEAAEALAGDGISAEVVDLRSLAPLDMETLLRSVERTRRAVVVHEAARTCGPAAEIATRLHEELHSALLHPVVRLTAPDSPIPAPAALVADFYPTSERIADTCRRLT